MIDTHAHLQSIDFDADLAEVIANAKNQGIEKIIIPAITPDDSDKLLKIKSLYPDLIEFSMGIHPHNAGKVGEDYFYKIEEFAERKQIVAIGEAGLDYFYDFCTPEQQKDVFKRQLQLAKKYNLPIIIHNRESDSDVLELIEQEQDGTLKGVLHCFSSDKKMYEKAIDLGMIVSFTGNITFKKSVLGSIIENADLNKIMIETDSPFMAPVPYRGKRNQPAYVSKVAEKIAEIKNIDFNKVVEMTSKNAKEFFKLMLLALIFTFGINSLHAQDENDDDEWEYEDEEEEEAELFPRLLGIGFVIGPSTNVQSQSATGPSVGLDDMGQPRIKQGQKIGNISYEGLPAFGASLYYRPFRFLMIDATYLYSKNDKVAEFNPAAGATITNMVEVTTNWIANPNRRVEFFGSAGIVYFDSFANKVSKTSLGFSGGLGFCFNVKFEGVGMLNILTQWKLNFDSALYEIYRQDKDGGVPAEYSQFFSIPRLSIIYFPEF